MQAKKRRLSYSLAWALRSQADTQAVAESNADKDDDQPVCSGLLWCCMPTTTQVSVRIASKEEEEGKDEKRRVGAAWFCCCCCGLLLLIGAVVAALSIAGVFSSSTAFSPPLPPPQPSSPPQPSAPPSAPSPVTCSHANKNMFCIQATDSSSAYTYDSFDVSLDNTCTDAFPGTSNQLVEIGNDCNDCRGRCCSNADCEFGSSVETCLCFGALQNEVRRPS